MESEWEVVDQRDTLEEDEQLNRGASVGLSYIPHLESTATLADGQHDDEALKTQDIVLQEITAPIATEDKQYDHETMTRVVVSLKLLVFIFSLLITQPLLFAIFNNRFSLPTVSKGVDFSSQSIYLDSFYTLNYERWESVEQKSLEKFSQWKGNIPDIFGTIQNFLYTHLVPVKSVPSNDTWTLSNYKSLLDRYIHKLFRKWKRFYKCLQRDDLIHRIFGKGMIARVIYDLKLVARETVIEPLLKPFKTRAVAD
ncbi:hypothetical protein HDV06_004434 [Boothiomyces sp. JEL0866]|nr:hypothetical protein HDV06_004434 [Boothiomyces sp. JEL0866]